jgi:hypothetical protein
MRPLLIVPIHVFHDRLPGIAHRVLGVQICPFVLHRLPKALNENVVTPGTSTIYAQLATPVLYSRYKHHHHKLTALVRVHDFRSAVMMKGFLKYTDGC